eukprot:283803_1
MTSVNFDNPIIIYGFTRTVESEHKNLSIDIPTDIILILQQYLKRLPCIIIDNGSSTIKAGFSTNETPLSVFPSVISKPRFVFQPVAMKNSVPYIGDEAISKRGLELDITYPIKKGIITNFDGISQIWQHTFNEELKIGKAPYEDLNLNACDVLLTEPVFNPDAKREKTIEIMFEKFNVNACYLACDAVLSLYASGRTTGCVWNSGKNVSHIVPIYEGKVVKHAVMRQDIGGDDITEHLAWIFTERGYAFTTPVEIDIVRDIKHKLGYVALDMEAEMKRLETECYKYELPDGFIIEPSTELIRATEMMFQPNWRGYEFAGIHDMIIESIEKCDECFRNDLYANIVLAGGNTMLRDADKRLKQEMDKKVPGDVVVNIIAPEDRKYSAWIGGSIFASLNTMDALWITRFDYNEHGASIVNKR